MINKEIEFQNNLLEKAKNGDMYSFEELIIQYEKLIFNISYRMFGNAEDAKDISQESLIKIYKNLEKCVDVKHFKSWICTITSNTCIDELRKRKGKTTESIDQKLELEEGAVGKQIRSKDPTPEEIYDKKELGKTLQNAIDNLSPDKKQLIVLRDIQGFSYNELAEITNISLGTVKSRLARARGELKAIIIKQKEQKNL